MKAIAAKGVPDWRPGTDPAPELNAAFRRVQEIGVELREANDALAVLDKPQR